MLVVSGDKVSLFFRYMQIFSGPTLKHALMPTLKPALKIGWLIGLIDAEGRGGKAVFNGVDSQLCTGLNQ